MGPRDANKDHLGTGTKAGPAPSGPLGPPGVTERPAGARAAT